jgi:hypothetical protein
MGFNRGSKHAVSDGAIRVDIGFHYTVLKSCTWSWRQIYSRNLGGCRRSGGLYKRSELNSRCVK